MEINLKTFLRENIHNNQTPVNFCRSQASQDMNVLVLSCSFNIQSSPVECLISMPNALLPWPTILFCELQLIYQTVIMFVDNRGKSEEQ